MEKLRLLFIDNLRVLLITLVIMVHLSITYGGVGNWYYNEDGAGTLSIVLLTWHNAAIQAFFMGLLFLIAAYFTPASYDRKGPARFLKDRFLRFGIPILCYDFVIEPLLVYTLYRVGHYSLGGSYLRWFRKYHTSFRLGTGPLWFIDTLLIFALLYALWRRLARSEPRTDRPFPNAPRLALFAILVGIATFVARLWFPIGRAFRPLNMQFGFFPQYICLLVIGIVAYHNNWLARVPDAAGKLCLIVAVILIIIVFPILFSLGGAMDGNVDAFKGGLHWQSFAYSLWEQLLSVTMIVTLLHFFRTRLNRQSKLVKTASDSSYAAYILHAPIIVLYALAARGLALHPLPKFALAVLICVPLCFTLGNVVRKLPLARRIL